MDINESINEMKEFQTIILDILNGDDSEEKYSALTKKLAAFDHSQKEEQKIKSLLLLIIKISNNHHRCPDFNEKVFKILLLFKSQINRIFSNDDIFNFFKGNKRNLLFLLEEGIFHIDEQIATEMIDEKYSKYKFKEYFLPELKDYIEKVKNDQAIEEIPDDFEEKRRIGENDNYICKLIRNDSVEDFITFVNRTNFPLRTQIEPSLFETNQFLLKNKPTLIEYSAFYGSIQIFQYLDLNQVELNPSLWLYVIHGKNAEMVHILEERGVKLTPDYYEKCIEESIKCHHNEFATYIKDNFDDNQISSEKNFFKNYISYSFHHRNYYFFPEKINEKCNFYYACKYDYFDIVEYFLNENIIDINMPIIFDFSLNDI